MMCCVLLCLLEVSEVLEVMRSVLGILHAGGCGGFEISIVWHFLVAIRHQCGEEKPAP